MATYMIQIYSCSIILRKDSCYVVAMFHLFHYFFFLVRPKDMNWTKAQYSLHMCYHGYKMILYKAINHFLLDL